MAQFYASIQGRRGEATRVGDKSSGMTGHIRGWNAGVRVDVSSVNGVDTFRIYRTGGSNHPAPKEIIAEFTEKDVK